MPKIVFWPNSSVLKETKLENADKRLPVLSKLNRYW